MPARAVSSLSTEIEKPQLERAGRTRPQVDRLPRRRSQLRASVDTNLIPVGRDGGRIAGPVSSAHGMNRD